jgi:hypothetical protein
MSMNSGGKFKLFTWIKERQNIHFSLHDLTNLKINKNRVYPNLFTSLDPSFSFLS